MGSRATRALLAAGLASLALIAGCGEDEDDDGAATTSAAATTVSTAATPRECPDMITSAGRVTAVRATIDCGDVGPIAEDVLSRDDCVEETQDGLNDCTSGDYECETVIEAQPDRFVVECVAGDEIAAFEYELSADGGQAGAPPEPEPQELTLFSTPSGNIGCAMDAEYVRCDIRERSWEPPPEPADCELDYGQGIELGGDGKPSFICAGDTTLGAEDVLEYGETSRVGPFRCISAAAGITCQADSGHGFFLSKQAFELY